MFLREEDESRFHKHFYIFRETFEGMVLIALNYIRLIAQLNGEKCAKTRPSQFAH